MNYQFHVAHLVLAVILYGALLAACRTAAKTMTHAALYFLAGVLAVNVTSFLISRNSGESTEKINGREAATAMGLNSGVTYPLVDPFTPNGHGRNLTAGYFTPAPYDGDGHVSFNFRFGNDADIIRIDPTTIRFDVRRDVAPNVTITLDDNDAGLLRSYGTKRYDRSLPCHQVIATAFWACNRKITSTVTVKADVRQQGLHPIVEAHQKSVTVTLTPEMHDNWILLRKG